MLDMEIESVNSILNEQEFKMMHKVECLSCEDEHYKHIAKVFLLSLIPNSNRKFVIVDEAKGIIVELRCLPAIEIYIALPKAYSSNVGPIFLVKTPFYQPFTLFLYNSLSEKWYENSMVIYEIAVFI